MTDEVRASFAGLVTDPSAIVAGESAITKAQNVVFRGEGIVEPFGLVMGTINDYARQTGFSTTLHVRQWPDGNKSWVCTDGATMLGYQQTPSADTPNPDTLTPDQIISSTPTTTLRSEQLGGTQMWTFAPVLRSLDGVTTPYAWMRAPGAPRPALRNYATMWVAGTGTGLAVDRTYGYRIVVKRKVDTSNGAGTSFRELYSAPSDRYVIPIRPGTTTPAALKLEVAIPVFAGNAGEIVPGDEIQVYRTFTAGPTATTDPGDEMGLRASYIVTAADALAQAWTFTDSVPDGEWNGPTLYTCASQQGLLRSNYKVRNATDVALYENKACYAGASAGWRHVVSCKRLGNAQDPSQAIVSAYCSTPVSWAVGFLTITGIPAAMFPYLAVGQVVTGMGGGLDADPHTGANSHGAFGRINSINAGAGSITLDTNHTAVNAAVYGFVAWDWVGVSDTTNPGRTDDRVFASWIDVVAGVQQYAFTNGSYVFNTTATTLASATMVSMYGGPALEACWSRNYNTQTAFRSRKMYTFSGSGDLRTDVGVEVEYDANFIASNTTIAGAPQFAITSSKPQAWSETIGTYFDQGYGRATLNGGHADLWYSKLGEYEAIPETNKVTVGNPQYPISRIIQGADRLWVLKPDGLFIFQGSGDTPDTVSLTQFDPTFHMLYSNTANAAYDGSNFACKLGDAIFALTRRGVAQIDASGVTYVDGAIATSIRALTSTVSASGTVASYVNGHMFASERDGLVVLGGSLNGLCPTSYVYNVANGTWSTLETSQVTITGGGVSADGTMVFGCRNGVGTYQNLPIWNSSELVAQAYTWSVLGQCVSVLGEEVTMGTINTVPAIGEVFFQYQTAGYRYTVSSVTDTLLVFSQSPTMGPLPVGSMIQDAAGAYFRVVSTAYTTINPYGDFFTATVDRAGFTAGDAASVIYPLPSVLTFAATTQGMPHIEKRAKKTAVSFRRLRGGTNFAMKWRARNKVASTAVSHTVTYDPVTGASYPQYMEDRAYSISQSVSTDAARFTGVDTTLSFSEAGQYFALDSFTLIVEPYTDRLEGGS